MAFEVNCGKCGARFTLPDDLYERKVRGRVVTIRCKKCRADITVDGTKHEPAGDMTPTVPLSGPGSLPAVGGLWVVSFGDDDDRELTVGQVKKALENGEINRETLVWNTSLDEWLMLGEVPALAELAPEDEVGGFLGTGVAVGSEAELLGDDEVGPFRSVGAGTMSDRPELGEPAAKPEPQPADATKEPPPVEGTPTLPLAVPPAKLDGPKGGETPSKPPPKPEKKLPTAPPKVQPAWLSSAPPKPPPATEDPDLPEGEEVAPSSGTPDLRTLMTGSLVPPKEEVGSKDESVSEDIFAIGGGGIAAQLPTIDLTNIEPPPPSSDPKSSRKRRDDDAPASSDRPRAKTKKAESKTGKTKRPPPAPSGRQDKSAKAAPAEEEKSGSPAMWIVLALLGAVAVYWFFLRSPDGAGSTEPTPRPTAETRTDPTPQPTTPTTVPTVSPAVVDSGPSEDAATVKKEEKPVEKVEPRETPVAKEEKPPVKEEKPPVKEEKPAAGTGGTSGEVAMAPPFDANAARAALNSAAGAASGCRQEGDPSGTATVVVTFAPSGRVTSANISGPPFAGTKTGGCIAGALRGAKVPAFSGEHVTVSKTVVIQ
ncbi:MAG: hypothetical protein DYH12_01040 [Sorangiineae bacterium PRO1]|nr:hypothetical protein [Sorangiineae bacterium PRO1]